MLTFILISNYVEVQDCKEEHNCTEHQGCMEEQNCMEEGEDRDHTKLARRDKVARDKVAQGKAAQGTGLGDKRPVLGSKAEVSAAWEH